MIFWVFCGLLSCGAVPFLLPIFSKHRTRNYLGEEVPSSLGYAFLLPAALMMTARGKTYEYAALFALALSFFALLGAIDDVYGDRSIKGFGGHLGQRRSTGAIKAWGGAAAALAISAQLGSSGVELVVNGAIIALFANFLNLLDVRPGRAGKVFLLLALILLVLRPQILAPLLGLIWAVAGYLPWDLRRVVLMGDVGSNPLGAALGLGFVLAFPALPFKIALALLLLGLNLLSERISFSKVIESNRFFHFLDQLGR